MEFKSRCYGFFVQNYDRLTWKKAKSKCRSFNGGDLVSIGNDAENKFIAKTVLSMNTDLVRVTRDGTKGSEFYHPWIGLFIRKTLNGIFH